MRLHLTLALISILPFAIATDAQTQTQTRQASAVIIGRIVRSGSGGPLNRATVSLIAADGQVNRNQTTTRDDGTFEFINIAPGQYGVSAERYGFITQEYGQRSFNATGKVLTLSPGQRLSGIDFQMSPAGIIEGRVFTRDGEAAANVYVEALSYEYLDGKRTLTSHGLMRTNDLGEYRLFWLAPGEYFVSAPTPPLQIRGQLATTPDEYYPRTYYPGEVDPNNAVPISLAPSAEVRGIDLIIHPIPTVKVRGRVVFSDPVPGAALPGQSVGGIVYSQIFLLRTGLSDLGTDLALILTGAANRGSVSTDGSFNFQNVSAGSYNLLAVNKAGRFQIANAHVEVGDRNVDDLTVVLRPGLHVPGRIFMEDTAAAPPQFKMDSLQVLLKSSQRLPASPALSAIDVHAEVKADGSFVVPDLGTIGYRVSITGLPAGAYLTAGRYGSADALNEPIQISDLNLPLQLQIGFTPGRIEGTVNDARGQAFGGAVCALVPSVRSRTELYRTTTAGADGKFNFTNIVPGDYKLFAWEDIPQGAYLDARYLRGFEERGQDVRVDKNSSTTLQLRVIPLN